MRVLTLILVRAAIQAAVWAAITPSSPWGSSSHCGPSKPVGPPVLSLFPFSFHTRAWPGVPIAGAAFVIDTMPLMAFASSIPPAPPMTVSPIWIGIPIRWTTPVGLYCPGVAMAPDLGVTWSLDCQSAQPPPLNLRCSGSHPAVNSLLAIDCLCALVTHDCGCRVSLLFLYWFLAKTFCEPTPLSSLLCTLLLLTWQPSSGSPEELGVSFWVQFGIKIDYCYPRFACCQRSWLDLLSLFCWSLPCSSLPFTGGRNQIHSYGPDMVPGVSNCT